MSYVYNKHPYLPTSYFSHLSPEVLDIAERGEKITLSQWKDMRLNSYARSFLIPFLTEEALFECCRHALSNLPPMEGPVPTTYDESIAYLYLPELIARLKHALYTERA